MAAECDDIECHLADARVHRGMHHAAKYIRDKLQQEQILEAALNSGPGSNLSDALYSRPPGS